MWVKKRPLEHLDVLSRLMTKPTKWRVRPAKTQISLGFRPVWSEPSLSAWRKFGSFASHWAHSEDSDQTGRMPRLIWVFAGRTDILFVLSWGSSILTQSPGLFGYVFSPLANQIHCYDRASNLTTWPWKVDEQAMIRNRYNLPRHHTGNEHIKIKTT